MGENEVVQAAKNVIKLNSNIKGQKTSFLMIVTNTQLAYQRTDGVYVAPIGTLKP